MPSLLRSLSQRFRRSHRRDTPDGLHCSGGPGNGAVNNSTVVDTKRQCQCKVMLLDGTDLNIAVNKRAFGIDVYEQVFYLLDLEERDYFGLQFMDHYHVQHWLDPSKKLSKQVPIGPPFTFRFRVKFYSSEPNNLREELTRYQFFLQLKQDILSGKLECGRDLAIELAALALQSEVGDFNPIEHTPAFVSEFRFHPEQDEAMELAIVDKFKECRGQTPAMAELNYLNKAKWLELYGVDMHSVQGKDGNQYRLGLTPTGMLVFDGQQKIGLFFWPKIQKLSFKNRKLTLVVEEDEDPQNNGQVQLHTFVFNLTSHKASKHLWKCAIEHHSFFRLTSHHGGKHPRAQLFRLGSTFRYRGKTEYENVHKDGGRLSRRTSNTFERKPSQRYGPRQSHLIKRQQFRNDLKQQTAVNAGIPLSSTPPVPVATEMQLNNTVINSMPSGHSSPLGSRPSPIGSSNTSTGTTIHNKDNNNINNINNNNQGQKIAAAEARLNNLIFANNSSNSIVSNGVHPNSIVSNGIHPNSIVSNGIHPNSIVSNGIHRDPIVSNGIHPNSIVSNGIHPNSIVSNGVHPNSIVSNGVHRDSSSEMPQLAKSPSATRRTAPFHYHSASNLLHHSVNSPTSVCIFSSSTDGYKSDNALYHQRHHPRSGRASAPLRITERIYDTPRPDAHITTIAITDRGSQIHSTTSSSNHNGLTNGRIISSPSTEHKSISNGHAINNSSSRIPKYIVASAPSQPPLQPVQDEQEEISLNDSKMPTEKLIYFGIPSDVDTTRPPSKLPIIKNNPSASFSSTSLPPLTQSKSASTEIPSISSRIPKYTPHSNGHNNHNHQKKHQHLGQTPVLQSAYTNSAFKHDGRSTFNVPIIRTGLSSSKNTQSRVITEL